MGLLLFYFLNFRRQREAGRERARARDKRERERGAKGTPKFEGQV